MMKLTVAVIDDEESAIENIQMIADKFFDDIEIVGTASNVLSGVKMLHACKPDVLLLDVDMPPHTGFDLLDIMPDRNFKVIFITAHSKHAIRAFKYSAVDYILKPVVIEELRATLDKVRLERSKGRVNNLENDSTDALFKNLKGAIPSTLVIHTTTSVEYIPLIDINYIQAEGSYSKVYFRDGKYIMATKGLKELDDFLSESFFCRPHKSYVVNLNSIRKIHKTDLLIELFDGTMVELSRRRKQLIFDVMNAHIRGIDKKIGE